MNPNSEIRLSKNSEQEVMEFGQKLLEGYFSDGRETQCNIVMQLLEKKKEKGFHMFIPSKL